MAIREKKQLLHEMFSQPPAPEGAPAAAEPVVTAAAAVSEKRIDRAVASLAFIVLWLLVLIGLAAAAWTTSLVYSAGASFASTTPTESFIKYFFRLAGGELFACCLGIAIIIMFREALPRVGKWIALGALILLLPVAIAAAIFLPMAYQIGRNAAFARLDVTQLLADAAAIDAAHHPATNDPIVIDIGDPDYATLPSTTLTSVHPQTVYIFPRAVMLGIGRAPAIGYGEFLVIPTRPLSPSQITIIAAKSGYTLLPGPGGTPIFRAENPDDIDEVYDPSVAPATSPVVTRSYGL